MWYFFKLGAQAQSFNVSQDPTVALMACCYLLYKKFYNQVFKNEGGTKVITLGTTTKTTLVQDDVEEVATKKKAITKQLITISGNLKDDLSLLPSEFLKHFATGFFPASFLSKLYIFAGTNGETYKATMRGPKGQKYLSFVKKIEEDVDYV